MHHRKMVSFPTSSV